MNNSLYVDPALIAQLHQGLEKGLWTVETLNRPSDGFLRNMRVDLRCFPNGYQGIEHRNMITGELTQFDRSSSASASTNPSSKQRGEIQQKMVAPAKPSAGILSPGTSLSISGQLDKFLNHDSDQYEDPNRNAENQREEAHLGAEGEHGSQSFSELLGNRNSW